MVQYQIIIKLNLLKAFSLNLHSFYLDTQHLLVGKAKTLFFYLEGLVDAILS